MSVQRVVGIDSGENGGVAIYTFDHAAGTEKVEVYPLPIFIKSNGKYHVNIHDLRVLLKQHVPLSDNPFKSIDLAVIEQVHAMPEQGIVSTATFLENYGLLKGALLWQEIPLIEPSPIKWKNIVLPSLKTQKQPKAKQPVQVQTDAIFAPVKTKSKAEKAAESKERNERKKFAKKTAIDYVLKRFPGIDLTVRTKTNRISKNLHDGMAEAVCIALYGRYYLRGSIDN